MDEDEDEDKDEDEDDDDEDDDDDDDDNDDDDLGASRELLGGKKSGPRPALYAAAEG